jgi:hypothetical protein
MVGIEIFVEVDLGRFVHDCQYSQAALLIPSRCHRALVD